MKDSEALKITVILDGEHRKRLKTSSSESARSFRQEAKIRIEDHLKLYASIAKVGSRLERN
ncbi:TraY domain-containing protein [Candidatus Enterovibrio escicola]|uniref:TraY domain-containing protein n=1 Tax=Candidatus Enterovibrio escicola TaxID=1927127 RepID=UPI0012380FD3|nr:TraY domain-containing protein [Candidatus Enterovibrio escacola]